jgi:hypothetical protein
MLDPVEDVVASQPRGSLIPIMIDDGHGGEYRDQGGSVGPNRQNRGTRVQDAVVIDDSRDVVMMDPTDIAENYPNFSRESSRTLSAESLPSLIELEVNTERNTETGRLARRYLERQRDEVRAHTRAQHHWN